jgi:uncharacterized protein (DUF2147 family)
MKRICILALLLLSLTAAEGQSSSVLGNWTNPTGSTIQIYPCGAYICAKVIAIRKNAPSRVDGKNPNRALRTRSLCDLQIGWNFQLTSPSRAEGGHLYDPESGNTYSGSMTRAANTLKLRGYIGFSLFGRTEIWTRAPANTPLCHP